MGAEQDTGFAFSRGCADLASIGRAVLDVFLLRLTHQTARFPKNVKGGNLGERDEIGFPGSEGGRRRQDSAVAALPSNPLVTALFWRRWVAGGGPEGR